MSWLRQGLRSLLLWFLLASAWQAACGPSAAYVVVRFEAGAVSLAEVTRLDLEIRLDGRSEEQTLAPGGLIQFPSAVTLDLGSTAGTLTLVAYATLPGGDAVGRATAEVQVVPGSSHEVRLVFEPTRAAHLLLSPGEYNFGPTLLSSPGQVQIEVRNDGIQKSGAIEASVSGDAFAVASSTCQGALAGSATCALSVQLRATAEADYSAVLTVRATPGGTQQLMLRGSGTRHVSAQRLGGPSSDTINGIAIDDQGHVVAAGYFRSTVNFGSGDVTSAGLYDAFVVKYDAQGRLVWSKQFGSADGDHALAVAIDAGRNVWVVGYFNGTVSFGGAPLTSAGNADIYIAKYTADGTHLWSKRLGGTDNDQPLALALDSNGNAFLTGYFYLSVDFGGGTLASAGDADVWLMKLGSDGRHLWSMRFGGPGNDVARGLAVNRSGDVVIVGHFSGSVDFGSGPLTSAGDTDIFVAKYSSVGSILWARRGGGSGTDSAYSVAMDDAGSVVTAGSFTTLANFGGSPLSPAGGIDIFVAKYDAAGSHLWSKGFGATFDDRLFALAADGTGALLLTGQFGGNIDFGGGVLVSSADNQDAFVAKLDASGGHVWSKRYGSSSQDAGFTLALGKQGVAAVGGIFGGTVDFGSGPLSSAGGSDGFVLRVVP